MDCKTFVLDMVERYLLGMWNIGADLQIIVDHKYLFINQLCEEWYLQQHMNR